MKQRVLQLRAAATALRARVTPPQTVVAEMFQVAGLCGLTVAGFTWDDIAGWAVGGLAALFYGYSLEPKESK